MKSLKNLPGIKLLSKKQQKTVKAGYLWEEPDPEPCGWPMCRNFFGRCSMFAC